MAFIDDVCDQLAVNLTAAFAPYQPNIPGVNLNLDPRAGVIQPTLVAAGHAIQIKATTRLENKMATVTVYDIGPERIRPFIDDTREYGQDEFGSYLYEVGRSEKRVVVEIWSVDRPSRRAIQNIVRAYVTDAFRQRELDGTTTLFRYADTIPFDAEQKDSFYIGQIHLMADFVVLGTSDGAPVKQISVDLKLKAGGQTIDEILFGYGASSGVASLNVFAASPDASTGFAILGVVPRGAVAGIAQLPLVATGHQT